MTRLESRFYSDDARAMVYRSLVGQCTQAVKAGSTVVAEATFREDWARDDIQSASASLPFAGLWLTAPTAIRVDRVSHRSSDVSDATAAIASAQTEPQKLGASWHVIDVNTSIDRVAYGAWRALRMRANSE